MSIRDVLVEDRRAIEKVHFQDHEILLRHLYETVQRKVAAFLPEQASA